MTNSKSWPSAQNRNGVKSGCQSASMTIRALNRIDHRHDPRRQPERHQGGEYQIKENLEVQCPADGYQRAVIEGGNRSHMGDEQQRQDEMLPGERIFGEDAWCGERKDGHEHGDHPIERNDAHCPALQKRQGGIAGAARRQGHHEPADDEKDIDAGDADARADGVFKSGELPRVMEHDQQCRQRPQVLNGQDFGSLRLRSSLRHDGHYAHVSYV